MAQLRVIATEFSLQLTPGHEVVGKVAKFGKSVKGFTEGDRCVVDPGTTVRFLLNGGSWSLTIYSAEIASFADADRIFSAKTSTA